MPEKIPISVVVSVKNEELNLPSCLDRLNSFDEVIVVDSMSTDNTPDIVKSYNYRLVNFQWNGKFPKKRNWTLRNVVLRNEWVLFLDADEIVPKEFVMEISTAISNSSHNSYLINYRNHFMGKQLKHGDKMRKLALFKKSCGEYEFIEEDSWSHLDMEIHEHPQVSGHSGVIKTPITHNDYKGLDHYIAKHNAYSTWEAKRYLSLKKETLKCLTWRQKVKYTLITSGLLPFIYFCYSYFIKLGILDGSVGYYFARYKANYFLQIQTKIQELKSK